MKRSKLRCGGQILYVPVTMLISDPLRPRIYFDNDGLSELCASIEDRGILKPLTVTETKKGKYKIVSGERRFRAAVMAGLDTVPCILTHLSDEEAAFNAISENLLQCSLNYFELALSLEKLHTKLYYPYDLIAEKLGIGINEITEKLRLLSIPEELRTVMIENGVTEKHAKELVRLNDADKALLVREITEKRLNVSQTKQRCREILGKKNRTGHTVTYFKDITVFINTIDKAITAMKTSGIGAKAVKNEKEDSIEYNLIIPK